MLKSDHFDYNNSDVVKKTSQNEYQNVTTSTTMKGI